jgi:hypothetical protein
MLYIDRISRLKRELYVQKRKKALREDGASWPTGGERPPLRPATRL